MLFLFIFICGLTFGASFSIPRNTSEGLIFCCSDDKYDAKTAIDKTNIPPFTAPHTETDKPPAVASTFDVKDVDEKDYSGIHQSIAIRRRRPCERECVKYTQPRDGCYWIHGNSGRSSACNHYVHSGVPVRKGEFPYMAAVGFTSGNETLWACGGTLISRKFVLTAAHCAYSRDTESAPSVVRLGVHNFLDPNDTFYDSDVAGVTIHPNYTLAKKYYDIALLELAIPISWFTNRIRPACLWPLADLNFSGRPTVLGWGRTGYKKNTSDVLLKGFLDIVPKESCRDLIQPTKLFPGLIDEQICAMDLRGKDGTNVDTCEGDSGGPLLATSSHDTGYDVPYIIGITSFGKTCTDSFPGIYTRVSSYISWIESVVWRDNDTDVFEILKLSG